MANMYAGAKTWNPFVGCAFDCAYCRPSFQAQAKRQKHRCMDCYNFTPHWHPERLGKIPNSEIVFVCGNGDISFCPPGFMLRILAAIHERTEAKPGQTFYLQSKDPGCFEPYLAVLPGSVVLLTTLETNLDKWYEEISSAPCPSDRYRRFYFLSYHRKGITIEPVIKFSAPQFAFWVESIAPEFVYIGYNSRPKQVQLPEPSEEKVAELIRRLQSAGIEVRGKDLRGIELEG